MNDLDLRIKNLKEEIELEEKELADIKSKRLNKRNNEKEELLNLKEQIEARKKEIRTEFDPEMGRKILRYGYSYNLSDFALLTDEQVKEVIRTFQENDEDFIDKYLKTEEKIKKNKSR